MKPLMKRSEKVGVEEEVNDGVEEETEDDEDGDELKKVRDAGTFEATFDELDGKHQTLMMWKHFVRWKTGWPFTIHTLFGYLSRPTFGAARP